MLIQSREEGWGYLAYWLDGNVWFFRVSFSPILSDAGYQKRQFFCSQLSKDSKEDTSLDQIIVQCDFYSLKCAFGPFFLSSH